MTRSLLALAATLIVMTAPALASGFDPERIADDLEKRGGGEALAEAAILRLGLGDFEAARRDRDALTRHHGKARPDLVARVVLFEARGLAGMGDWHALRARLRSATPMFDQRVDIDDRLEAYALLGRALDRLGRRPESVALQWQIVAMGRGKALGERGRDAVAEAYFRLAEIEHEKANRIVMEPYVGKRDRVRVLVYLDAAATQWIPRRRKAIEAAEAAYLRVLGVEPRRHRDELGADPMSAPLPSPRWAIAAASRVAKAWIAFIDEARSLPTPDAWAGHGIVPGTTDLTYEDLRGERLCYTGSTWFDEEKQRAKRACATALDLGLTAHIADEHTEACLFWLSRNYSYEYSTLPEQRPKIAPPREAMRPAPAPRTTGTQ